MGATSGHGSLLVQVKQKCGFTGVLSKLPGAMGATCDPWSWTAPRWPEGLQSLCPLGAWNQGSPMKLRELPGATGVGTLV